MEIHTRREEIVAKPGNLRKFFREIHPIYLATYTLNHCDQDEAVDIKVWDGWRKSLTKFIL